MGALGYIGVPIAAAGMGGWLSYKRANEEVRKKEILGREGVEDKSKTAKNFVKADTLATNFDRLMSRIKEESGKPVPNEAKIKELKESLSLRIKYASDKMDQGLVDFGATKAQLSKTAEERAESEKRGVLGNKFFLFRKFSEAMIAGEFNAPNEQGEVFKKLESF